MTIKVEDFVVQLGAKRLREKSDKIMPDDNLQKQIEIMTPILYDTNGLGLAAPQVANVPNNRLVIYNKELKRTREEGDFVLGVMINPEIIRASDEMQEYEESCLSVVGISAKVKSPSKVIVKYQDLDRKYHEEAFEDLGAVLMNHEISHLNGELYVDRIINLDEKKAKLKEYKNKHQIMDAKYFEKTK